MNSIIKKYHYWGLKRFLFSEVYLKKIHDVDYFKKELSNYVKKTGVLFIHIPKAAGTSFVKSLYDRNDWTHLTYLDFSKIIAKDEFDNLIKLAVVRNPYERLFSGFNYLKFSSKLKWDRYWVSNNIQEYDFDDFVMEWLSLDRINNCAIDHFKTQFSFLRTHHDTINIDYLCRLETIEDDLLKIKNKYGLELQLDKRNATKQQFNIDLISRESINKINKVYEIDFKKFNYEKISRMMP